MPQGSVLGSAPMPLANMGYVEESIWSRNLANTQMSEDIQASIADASGTLPTEAGDIQRTETHEVYKIIPPNGPGLHSSPVKIPLLFAPDRWPFRPLSAYTQVQYFPCPAAFTRTLQLQLVSASPVPHSSHVSAHQNTHWSCFIPSPNELHTQARLIRLSRN